MPHPGTSLSNSVALIKEMHKTEVFVYQKEDIEIKRKSFMSINGVYIKLNYIDVNIVSLECVKQIKVYIPVLFCSYTDLIYKTQLSVLLFVLN